jgi:hypothetical protein
MGLLVHLLILVLVFGILAWLVQLIAGVLPANLAQPVRVILFCILGLVAISVLLGDAGLYAAPWRSWR